MDRSIINYLILFVSLLLAQVLIFNHIVLFGVATPIIYIYLIISLPISSSVNLLLLISFLSGLSIDIFSDILGVNCLAAVIMTMCRKPILSLYNPRENDNKGLIPTIKSLGLSVYIKYVTSLVLIYCIVAYGAEYLSFVNFGRIVFKIFSSTILTTLLLLGFDSLIINRREKRL